MIAFFANHISTIMIIFRGLESLKFIWCLNQLGLRFKTDGDYPEGFWFYVISNIFLSTISFVVSFFVQLKGLCILLCCHVLILLLKYVIAFILKILYKKREEYGKVFASTVLEALIYPYYQQMFGSTPSCSQFDYSPIVPITPDDWVLEFYIDKDHAIYYSALLKSLIEKKDISHYLNEKN